MTKTEIFLSLLPLLLELLLLLLELLLLLLEQLLLLLHIHHINIEVPHNNTIDRLQAQQLYVWANTCHRLGRKPHPHLKLLSVREEEKRRHRWRRNNAGRSWCAFPIGGAKAAIQHADPATGARLGARSLHSELFVGSF